MEVTNCINFILTNTQNAVGNYFKHRLAEYDLTPGQYNMLRILHSSEAMTPSQLAVEMHLDTSSITGMLGRLEAKGLIERTYNPDDRRSVSVSLNESAKVLWNRLDSVIEDANRVVQAGISPAEYAALADQLRKIEENAKNSLE